ncbi:MAG: DUF4268 domain-containing protein [Clostridia bacterium]|nr:DUF4268 domain-containing protein [Clostridia bacterium]
MTYKETWNYLVKHHNENIETDEKKIQKDWESFFADAGLFKYSNADGDVVSHQILQFGSKKCVIPDIVLRKNNDDLFVVELKKYSLPVSKDHEAQLFSYLKLLHVFIGVLVCEKIYIYAYDFNTVEQENRLEISFEEDNADGIAFVELFCKESFSKEKIMDFISGKKSFDKNVQEIKKQLNHQLVCKLVKNYFLGKYSAEEVETALIGSSFLLGELPPKAKPVLEQLPIADIDAHKQKTKGYNTDAEKSNLKFWTKFNEYAFGNAEFKKEFTMKKPTSKHWYNFSIGSSKCHIAATHLKDKLGIEIYIQDCKSLYDHFFSHKNEIEAIVGRPLEWKRLPKKKGCPYFNDNFSI